MAEGPNESRPESIGENPFGPLTQPPLSIAHLMLWTAGSAVVLAMDCGADGSIDSELPDAMRTIQNVHCVLSSMLYGAAIASVAVFVHRRLTGGTPFPVQPGHWLLFIKGLIAFIALPGWRLFVWLQSQGISNDGSRWVTPAGFFVGVEVLTYGTRIGAFGWALRRLQAERRWRLLFWLELGFSIGCLLSNLTDLTRWSSESWAFGFHWCSALVLAVWLVVAAILDGRRRVRRDWLHWTGVVVQFGGVALFILTILCAWLVL